MTSRERIASDQLSVVAASTASWEDLQAVFGTRGDPARCQCQRFEMAPGESCASVGPDVLGHRLREQADCGQPEAQRTVGLVARYDGVPVGWCAVEPRSAYRRLLRDSRVPWTGRTEDKADSDVWAVSCFVTRTGFRRRGISAALAAATVGYARQNGARALEGYPMVLGPGQVAVGSELHVGTRSLFEAAGFSEVSAPTPRRVVMRIDF